MNLGTSSEFRAIGLILNGTERYKLIRTVADAAEVLVRDWPCDDGEEYINALVACLNAYKGAVSAEVARQTLIRAADEVSIPYLTVVY